MTVDKEKLLAPRIGEGIVSIEGLGEIHVRPLTRAQAIEVYKTTDLGDAENMLIHLGMVEPRLTLAEVEAWAQSAPAGEIQAVSQAIGIMSGMTEKSGKESYKSVRGESGPGV